MSDNTTFEIREEKIEISIEDKDRITLNIEDETVEVIEVGIPGAPGKDGEDGHSVTYVHHQSVAASVWHIKHDLNKYPSVTIVDTAGNVIVGDVIYLNDAEVEVVFASQFSGDGYLN